MAKEDRGFASMDPNKQREIASKGGKAAHQKGTAHEWTSEEARNAGRKGGLASHRRRREQQNTPLEGGREMEPTPAGRIHQTSKTRGAVRARTAVPSQRTPFPPPASDIHDPPASGARQ